MKLKMLNFQSLDPGNEQFITISSTDYHRNFRFLSFLWKLAILLADRQ